MFQINQIGPDTIRVQLSDTVVVNSAYTSLDTYTISSITGGGDISVRSVVVPVGFTTTDVILYVDKPVKGTIYELTINALRRRDGAAIIDSARFEGRQTKGENMLKEIPSHWDTRPTSIVRNVITAIAIEDDKIGGSRDDRL